MKVKNISPKLSARANYTFSGMTILQHEPAAAPKKVFLPCVSLPRANFYENIFYNAFALGVSLFILQKKYSLVWNPTARATPTILATRDTRNWT